HPDGSKLGASCFQPEQSAVAMLARPTIGPADVPDRPLDCLLTPSSLEPAPAYEYAEGSANGKAYCRASRYLVGSCYRGDDAASIRRAGARVQPDSERLRNCAGSSQPQGQRLGIGGPGELPGEHDRVQ